MTTIAYRDGVLAADTLHSVDGIRTSYRPKVEKLEDGSLFASKGNSGAGNQIRDWIVGHETGSQPLADIDGTGAVCIRPDGTVDVFEGGYREELRGAPYFAFGSGAQIALGAMHAGASAEDAVRAAIAHDCFSGGQVVSVTLKV